jgi:hypothetical protein
MAKLKTNHKLSTAYHPQTDGQTECINQVIKAYLQCYINLAQDNWVEKLPSAQMQYNSSVSESTGVTPFYANYRITPEAYRPPQDGPNADNAQILAEDLVQL